MTRYRFHLWNRIGPVRDDEGKELPDLEAARAEAIASIRSLLSDEVKQGRLDLRGRIEITDGDDEVQAVVAFTEALDLHLEPSA